jgi:hypothetical protein
MVRSLSLLADPPVREDSGAEAETRQAEGR